MKRCSDVHWISLDRNMAVTWARLVAAIILLVSTTFADGALLAEDQSDWIANQHAPNNPVVSEQLSRLVHLCNDHHKMSGEEGLVFPGYTLRQVHFLLTPGEVTVSSDVVPIGYKPLNHSECHFSSHVTDSNKIHALSEILDTYRKMSPHTPVFKGFSPMPSLQGCSDDQLTARGAKQHVALGEFLHKKYFQVHEGQHKLQPASSQIHAESVVRQSAFQSLLANLHGFLPEKEFINVQIHKALSDFCSTQESDINICHCPKVVYLQDTIEKALTRGTFLFKNAFPHFHALQDLLGELFSIHQKKISSVDLLKLSLNHVCSNNSMPCDGTGKCLTVGQQSSLARLASEFYKNLFSDHTFTSHCQLLTHPFLQRVIRRSMQAETDRRFYLHSSDQVFLPCVLNRLGYQLDLPPPSASRLVFEVYQKKMSDLNSGKLFLRFLLNGEDITNKLQNCDGRLNNGFCPLETFAESHSQLKFASYEANCRNL